ncbi:hypothetical protein HRbin29_01958 [bacterium HR29]|nr:hypothetical protein HRbin29_01958 [bacterium HR29]
MREASWALPEPGAEGAFVEEVRAWMAECGAGMRRPYGVDHVALALSCRDQDGRARCSTALGIRPLGEYLGPRGERELLGFIRDARLASPEGGTVKVVFLSMGDLLAALETAA